MSLLFRALKKAEDKNQKTEAGPQMLAQDGGDKPRRRGSRSTLLGFLLVLSAVVIGGLLYLPDIEELLAPRAVPVAAVTPLPAPVPAGPTAAERAAEEQRLAEEARVAEEQRLAEEARVAEETARAEQARRAAETRRAEDAAQRQAESEARWAEEQRRADEIGAAARVELAMITEAVEQARREREALDLVQRLAREQAAADVQATRLAEESAQATLTALREEIARQQAAIERLPAAGPPPTPPAAAEAAPPEATPPEAAPEPMPEPKPEPSPAAVTDGDIDVAALVIGQAGEPAPVAPSEPIVIERTGDRQRNALAGLITVIDESDYFKDRYDAARRSLNAGGSRSALSIYDELLERQPRDRVALLGRATALHQMNQSGEAIRAYETVLRYHADDLGALTNLLGLIGQQTPRSALKQLGRLYKSNPSFGAVAAHMAMIHLQLGDGANAIRLMSEAAALAPANPVYRINLAIMHDRAGDGRAAVSAYERALLAAAGSAEALPLSMDAIRERLRYLRAN